MRILPGFSQRLRISALTFSLLVLAQPTAFLAPAWAQQEAPSILNPAKPQNNKTYRFPLSIADPTPQSNPAGANAPGLRGENQFVLYTAAFGSQTGTNEAGFEAIVENGVITRIKSGNSDIPTNGFVLSGHGSAAQWLGRFGKIGSLASWDENTGQLTIQFTKDTYLQEVDAALRQATATHSDSPAYQAHLQTAQACRAKLAELPDSPVNTDMATLAEACLHKANIAFYNSIPANQKAFRGTWIRPDSTNREAIQKTIATLKQNHIEDIFLETYFQGKTIYPSAVMAAYGLPEQHPRYKNADPLKLWIEEAHQQGLKVHVWAQVFFAGNQKENIEQYGPILQKYPQWHNSQRPHWNNPNPVISDVEPGHYFLDPANPEVREFVQKLLMEMVNQYQPDGLNLDYIRYPASAATTKPYYLGTTWGYTEIARKQFKTLIEAERSEAETKRVEALKKAGKPASISAANINTPSADPKDLTPSSPLWNRWVEWRKEQVSSFVRQISNEARAANPNLLVSAVVFPSHDPTYALKLQDYSRWAKEGSIQALTPIGLSTNLTRMSEQCKSLRTQVQDKIPVYVGIFSLYNRTGPIALVQEINVTNQQGMGGVVLFDGARLTPAYSEALLEGPFRP